LNERVTRTWLDAVIVIALLPVAIVLGWQLVSGMRAERQRLDDELQRSAAGFAQSIDRELASSIDALTVLSQSEIFQQGRIAAMGRLLRGRPRRDWDSVFLIDANGTVVLDTAPHGSSLPPAAMRDLHARALRANGAAVSGVTASPGIAIALPIAATGQPGHARYVLGVRTSDGVWARLAANAPVPPGGYARIDDVQGHLISSSDNADEGELITASAAVPLAGWQAVIGVPSAPIAAAHRVAIVTALSTSGASLAIGLLLAALVARRITREVLAQERRHAKDELAVRLEHDLRDSLNAIATAADVLETEDPASETAAEARAIIARQTRVLADKLHDLRRASSTTT
jgi:signal transduction histidine kinase